MSVGGILYIYIYAYVHIIREICIYIYTCVYNIHICTYTHYIYV